MVTGDFGTVESRKAIIGRWEGTDGTVMEISDTAITTLVKNGETSQSYEVWNERNNDLLQGYLTIRIAEGPIADVTVTKSRLTFSQPDGGKSVWHRLP